jgi:hypothetical protein
VTPIVLCVFVFFIVSVVERSATDFAVECQESFHVENAELFLVPLCAAVATLKSVHFDIEVYAEGIFHQRSPATRSSSVFPFVECSSARHYE